MKNQAVFSLKDKTKQEAHGSQGSPEPPVPNYHHLHFGLA